MSPVRALSVKRIYVISKCNNMENRKRPQDEIPYEVIVMHIIADYRRIEQWKDKARNHIRKVESENHTLRAKLTKAVAAERDANFRVGKLRQQIKYLTVLLRRNGIPFNLDDATNPKRWRTLSKNEIRRVMELEVEYLGTYGTGYAEDVANYVYTNFVQETDKES